MKKNFLLVAAYVLLAACNSGDTEKQEETSMASRM
jgi:hypothetical protein